MRDGKDEDALATAWITEMIDLPIFWQYLIILATHYVADFILQTHWQASNKSKNNVALSRHVLVYTVVLAAVTAVLFGLTAMWFLTEWETILVPWLLEGTKADGKWHITHAIEIERPKIVAAA